ncbi:MAG: hypothetical protein ACFE8E_14205, partial [Candidatus Hodarchaeota archaeon]
MPNEERIFKVKKIKFKIKKIYLNLIYTFIIGLALFFLAINLSFLLSRFLPGDPVLAYLPEGHVNPDEYMQVYRQLGLDRPIIEQFFIYIGRMFTGNWGFSISIARGMDVKFLFMVSVPRTIDLLLLPLLIGVSLGLLFGNLSIKLRHKWLDKLFQIFTLIGCALPLFFLGMLFQYFLGYLLPIFPTTGFKTYSYGDPPLVTGFRIIDSLLSGELYYIPDYLSHFVLPWSVLTIGIGSLTTLLVRIYLLNKSKRRSIVPNSFNSAISIGLIFGYLVLIETTFGLSGAGQLFIQSIRNSDYWVLNSFVFLIPIIFVILLVLCNLLFIGYDPIKSRIVKRRAYKRSTNKELKSQPIEFKSNKNPSTNPKPNQLNTRKENKFKQQFKDFLKYFHKKLLSPLTIIGSLILIFFILVSIFPQILTQYSLEEANSVYPGAWNPPSPDHPFGQTKFGRDVLARVVYATLFSLINVLPPIGIGLIGGLLLGIPMGLLNRRFKMSSEISTIIFFIYPFIMIIILGLGVLWKIIGFYTIEHIMLIFSILIIPFFTLLIAKTRLNGFEIMKKVIPYIPLFIGFILLVDASVAFLGFSDPGLISFGNEIAEAREFVYIAPWASFWP